jgi:hypothetical protein
MKSILALLTFGALLHTSSSLAGTTPLPSGKEVAAVPPAPTDEGWRYTVGLPGWLAGLNGDIGIGGFQPVHTDVPFSKILDHLDMVASLSVEAQHGPWSLYAEGLYLKLSAGGETPGRLLDTISLEQKEVLLEAGVAYRIWDSPRGYFDLFAGARYFSMDATLHLEVNPSGVRAVSEDLASGAAAQVSAAVKDAVSEVKAPALEKVTAAAAGRIEDRVGEILSQYPRLPEVIRRIGAADGPVNDALRELVAAQLAEKQLAVADSVSAAKSRGSSAVQRAERKLARRIETALRNALPESLDGSKAWIDPVVGFRTRFNFTDHLYLAAKGDIGGFGVGSDLSWQVFGALGYQFNRQWSAELGYKYLSIDYAQDGVVFDAVQAGAFVGLKYTF